MIIETKKVVKNVHNVRNSIYEKDRALAEKRKQEAKEREIQELREAIEISKKRLAELFRLRSKISIMSDQKPIHKRWVFCCRNTKINFKNHQEVYINKKPPNKKVVFYFIMLL